MEKSPPATAYDLVSVTVVGEPLTVAVVVNVFATVIRENKLLVYFDVPVTETI